MDKILNYTRQVFEGKTIYRIQFNWEIRKHMAGMAPGKVVDLAAGGGASYMPYLPKGISITRTNYVSGNGIDTVADLNSDLPFDDHTFDAAILFNALYILRNRTKSLGEIQRILKPGGKLYLSSPFIANEMPEPDDFCRYTKQGLEQEFEKAGFSSWKITRFGERFTAAVYLLNPFYPVRILRLPVYAVALMLDKLIPSRIRKNYPAPLGYFCIATK